MEISNKYPVYTITENTTEQSFIDLGYDYEPYEAVGNSIVLFKTVTLPENHFLVKQIIDMFNNKEWQKAVLDEQGFGETFEKMGILFEEYTDEESGSINRYVIVNEDFIAMATSWRIEIDFSSAEKWISFTTTDIITPNCWCNKDILDNICKNEITELLENGLIKEILVEE